MPTVLEIASAIKFIAERGLMFRDDENVGSPKNTFKKRKLLVSGFATESHIANHCQLSCCIIKFCYT